MHYLVGGVCEQNVIEKEVVLKKKTSADAAAFRYITEKWIQIRRIVSFAR